METEIERIDRYEDERFSKTVLYQHLTGISLE